MFKTSSSEQASNGFNFQEKLLYVHQKKWQRDLLKYGSEIFLLNATYKTTKYAVPLFFSLCEDKQWICCCR